MSVAWFVDGAYANKAWQSVAPSNVRIDYALLRQELEFDADEPIGDAYFFDCDNDPPSVAQTAFRRYLGSPPPRGPGFRVKLYWLQSKFHEWPDSMGGGPVMHPTLNEQYVTRTQKAVDVGLSFHLIRSFSKKGWKRLYLFAGDGDFSEVVKHLVENEGVEVVIIGTRTSVSSELHSYVRLIDLAKVHGDVARENRNGS